MSTASADHMTEKLMTPVQVATFTNYSIRTIRRWRQAGWLHHVGLPHRPRYRREDVLEVMRALANIDNGMHGIGAT